MKPQIEITPFEKKGFRYIAYVVYGEQRVPVTMSEEDMKSPDALAIKVMKIKAALDQLSDK